MKRTFLVLASVFCLGAVSAQKTTISLEDALNATMESNEAIRSLSEAELAAKRERQAAKGLYAPRINANGSYIYMQKSISADINDLKGDLQDHAQNLFGKIMQNPTLGPMFQPLAGDIQAAMASIFGANWGVDIFKRNIAFVGANAELPIFMGGKIVAANKAAKLNEKRVGLQSKDKKDEIFSELIERYYGYAVCLDVIKVRQQVVDGMKKHLYDVEAAAREGLVSNTECLYVKYKLAEAERELDNAMLQASTVKQAFASTMGAENADPVPVTALFVLSEVKPLDYYKDLAQANNPKLGEVDVLESLAIQRKNALRADFMPQIYGFGLANIYSYNDRNILPRWAVGVGFNFKIFDGLSREYKYSAARSSIRRVTDLKSKAKRDINVLVEKCYNTMLNYANQMESIEASVAFAEEYLRSKSAAHRQGMASSTDVVDAELNLAKSRIERMQAAYNFDLNLAKLLEAAGASEQFVDYLHSKEAKPVMFND